MLHCYIVMIHAESENHHEVKPTQSHHPDSEPVHAFFTLGGKCRVKLAGVEAYVNVSPLYDYGLVDRTASKVNAVEAEEAHKIAGGDVQEEEIIEQVERQLDKSRLKGEALRVLSQIFREFGAHDVYVAQGVEGRPGFDTAKLGHKIDFGDATTFVVPRNRRDELERILHGAIPTAASEQNERFNLNLRWQFLKDEGIVVKYETGEGEEKVVFLFGETAESKEN